MSDLLGFATPEIAEATSDRAWLQAMLDVEAALARAGAKAGLIPPGAAEAITACCDVERFDLDAIAVLAQASATPVVPLVTALKALVTESAAPFVHAGATSQDIVDSAMCLLAARAIDVIAADLDGCATALATLARTHRDSVQIGRTLLQHAAPTTFGLVCAGWLVAVEEATATLVRVRDDRLAVQFGGPVGTLDALDARGWEVADLLAGELGLVCPTMPWHTTRGRIGELAGALGGVAGALATIALDVTLLAQSEVAEVVEGSGGRSSSMPHKRNPARAVMVTAVTHRAPGLVATVLAAAPQELQRATGRWQAEWPTLTELLRLTGTASAHCRAMLADLRVDAARMRANYQGAEIPSAGTGCSDIWIDRALAAHERRET
jgi:3-carboxy-cis,cis-muconate cycloisomerase